MTATGKVARRPRGAARAALVDAARDLFARQDYRSTTTREIAVAAGVAEHLLFRHFGSKATLFREALVVPFTELVDGFHESWTHLVVESASEEVVARTFLGALYDLFVDHRGLVMTLWAADTLTEEELAETGIAELDRAMSVIGKLGGEGADLLGIGSGHHDLAPQSTVAMVAGLAAFGAPFFGGSRPSRDAIVDEITQATLHGYLHRAGGPTRRPSRRR